MSFCMSLSIKGSLKWKKRGCVSGINRWALYSFTSPQFFYFFLKDPVPLNNKKRFFSGLTTQNAPRLNQVTYAAKNTIAGGSQFKSYRYREVSIRCRLQYREDCLKIEITKKTLPGSADSGRVPAKIDDDTGWVPPLQTLKSKIFWADFTSSHRYRRDSG